MVIALAGLELAGSFRWRRVGGWRHSSAMIVYRPGPEVDDNAAPGKESKEHTTTHSSQFDVVEVQMLAFMNFIADAV